MQNLIPTKARAVVYGIYAAVGVVIGSIQVAYAAAESGQPVWLTVALAVYAYVGGAIGYTALTHTSDAPEYVGEHREPVVIELGAEDAAERDGLIEPTGYTSGV